jgi:hypothetical protein
MNIEQRADALLGIAERKNQEPRELLIEVVKSQIKYLQRELFDLEIEKTLNYYTEIKEDIIRIFDIVDSFEAQKEMYYKMITRVENDMEDVKS